MHLSRFNLVRFAHLPTPFEPLPGLTERLARPGGGGPALWIKRDDCTGLAGGGNKTRKLEYLLGDALAADADTLVTQGAVQSNHVRQTAAAAAIAAITASITQRIMRPPALARCLARLLLFAIAKPDSPVRMRRNAAFPPPLYRRPAAGASACRAGRMRRPGAG